jgi:hypothetical protein
MTLYYGKNVSLVLNATLSPQSEKAFTFNKTRGVVIGENDDVMFDL